MVTCFLGMKADDSRTRVRISSGESRGASLASPGRTPARRSSGRENTLTNRITGCSSRCSGPSTYASGSAMRSG
ncbi:hypothetical protein D3C83_114040 [compost metagenome]